MNFENYFEKEDHSDEQLAEQPRIYYIFLVCSSWTGKMEFPSYKRNFTWNHPWSNRILFLKTWKNFTKPNVKIQRAATGINKERIKTFNISHSEIHWKQT